MRIALMILCLLSVGSDAVGRSLFPAPQAKPELPIYQAIALAAADLDADGNLDVVLGHALNDISILLGNGCGGFVEHARYETVELVPGDIATGDLDEDGRVDVVTSHYQGFSVFLGVGDGTLGPEMPYDVPNGFGSLLAIDDFNLDQHLDVLIGTSLLFGNGDGTLANPIPAPAWRVVADFDGDGVPDLGDHSVYLGDGDGSFTLASSLSCSCSLQALAAGDADNDGNVDLLLATEEPNTVRLMRGNGDGTFRPEEIYLSWVTMEDVELHDVDGDGWLDVVIPAWFGYGPTSGLVILYGVGGGIFGPANFLDTKYGAHRMVFGDFDGDGIDDVAKPDYWMNAVGILLADGKGGYSYNPPITDGELGVAVALADLDGDGRQDLIVADETTTDVSVALAEAAATFAPAVRYDLGTAPAWLTAASLNADAHIDLAVVRPGPPAEVVLFEGAGDGSLAPLSSLSVAGVPTAAPGFVVAADLDDDGAQDLVVPDEASDTIAIFPGNGDGTFGAQIDLTVGSGPRWVAIGDLDGDDDPDLAIALEGSQAVRIMLGVGDGTFVTGQSLGPVFPPRPIPTSIAIGDLDSDTVPDIAVAVAEKLGTVYGRAVDIHFGNGDGTFQFGGTHRVVSYPSSDPASAQIRIEDFDVDGRPDVALLDTDLVVLRGDGAGGFAAPEYFSAPWGRNSLAADDLNLDGRTDLVAVSFGTLMILNQSGPAALTFLADTQTLAWPAVTGATAYDVYRGNLGDLVDLDDDELPDSGYGVCLSGLDDDVRDTFFVDATVPSPEGDGFFYLRSAIVSGGSLGLGTTSGGLPRMPQTPCP